MMPRCHMGLFIGFSSGIIKLKKNRNEENLTINCYMNKHYFRRFRDEEKIKFVLSIFDQYVQFFLFAQSK